ncbi:hypothetical protein BJ322DRAFT_1107319 [Thelephora terrestris]|uniref:F-box domain-containing protein n=1 Tax=Thelephora terrestris TaxID=56493 RepID=A0A9P6HHC6_9AGAM|nr:hypothetical protein BJ322DRAFT_1107319 [Thelephora terrestris]
MLLSSALGRLRGASRDQPSPQPTEPQRSTISPLSNCGDRVGRDPVFEVTGYKSLLAEDAIPDLQRILASIANTVLAISEGDGLRNALKVGHSHIPRVEHLTESTQVLELEGTIFKLLQHIRALRNHARPIGRLPPELLSTVFELVAAPTAGDSAPTLKDIVSLTHVCRYWRAILLNHNGVWSDLHLKGQDPGLVARQLERCGGAALSVNVHLQYWMFRRENVRLLNNFRGALTEIRLHQNQIRRLVVHIACCGAFHGYFNFDLPNLEELVWEDLCVQHAITHNSTPPEPERNRLPRLRHLSVKRSLHWPMEFTNGLTTFKLEGQMMVPSDKLVSFLQRNLDLESLELINLHVPYQWLSPNPIELHHLTNLSIRNVEHGHIFPHVAVPALKRLEIGPFEQPPRWVASVWSSLQLPPKINSLTITCHANGNISVVGFDASSEQLLSLEENSVGIRLTPVFKALSDASLDLVTTLRLDEEGVNPWDQAPTAPILGLLRSLPQLRQVDLGWDSLTGKVIACLNDHRGLCPELKGLRVKVSGQSCSSIFKSVQELVLSRADAEQWLRQVECSVSGADGDTKTVKRLWDSLVLKSGLTSSLRDL